MVTPRGNVLVVDDDVAVGRVLAGLLTQAGFRATVCLDGTRALASLEKGAFDAVVSDIRMPGLDGMALLKTVTARWPEVSVVMMTAHATVALAVEAMKAGASDFIAKPFDREEILYAVEKAVRVGSASDGAVSTSSRLLGQSAAMQEVRALVQKAGATNATVLIRGESGTGKELVARAVHEASARSEKTFLAVNCGALPEALLESELFGYEKGAFTGATQRKPGRLELAQGGTLFLDEIGDLAPALQVKLLRVLQERTFERVGGTAPLTADVRFIAATHQPLEAMLTDGRFREDFFYRLNVVPIVLPPLRARTDDIPALAASFFEQLSTQHGRPMRADGETLAWLAAQPWPGNVRHLRNAVERLVVLHDGVTVSKAHAETLLGAPAVPAPAPDDTSLEAQRNEAEKTALVNALEQAKQNRTVAARLLGVSRRTLYNKLAALGLDG
ncbi:MAG: sigma-54-dependent Fis family transcriptional regulator [Archangium sp.]|nr:sigma-54-dependent Fis family transcriptional regulator [Archangium sp.]